MTVNAVGKLWMFEVEGSKWPKRHHTLSYKFLLPHFMKPDFDFVPRSLFVQLLEFCVSNVDASDGIKLLWLSSAKLVWVLSK